MATAVTLLNTPNKTQNFYPADDQRILQAKYIKPSTAFAQGTAMFIEIAANTTTGYITSGVVENASGADFVGILAETVATTDADYATAFKQKAVWVPRTPTAKAYFTVWAGTFTNIDVGKTVEVNANSISLSVDTAGKGARITDFISSTRGLCVFALPATETA